MMVTTSSGTGSFPGACVGVLSFTRYVGGVWGVLALILSGDGEGEVAGVAGDGEGKYADASSDSEERLRRWRRGARSEGLGFFFCFCSSENGFIFTFLQSTT